MSLTTVSVSLWWVIHPSQWFIKLCLWLLYQYHYDEWYTHHSDLSSYVSDYCISITMMSDTPITVIYQAMSLTTVSVSLWWVIHLSQWFIKLCLWLLYQYHYDEWYTHHSDLSSYTSDYCISITMMSDTPITVIYQAISLTTVSVSLWWVIHLSQWFIKLCLWLLSVSLWWVIHLSQWFIKQCLTTVSVLLWWVIHLSQWFIKLCLWLLYQYHYDEWYTHHSDLLSYVSDYCISITMMSDTPITVIYQAISLTTVSVSLWWVIHPSQWFITLCLLLYCSTKIHPLLGDT